MSDDPRPDNRLDDLSEKIESARDAAEDADILQDPDEPLFSDSGTIGDEMDDQQIAPPG